ncbi:putative aquaporin NIP4-2 [Bidens hawaiensis]|uniref:putative aquaporin NIP4-2 n=1 Tax=Bidens hawaiensis TaxID=980011 RepID=UPI00404AB815
MNDGTDSQLSAMEKGNITLSMSTNHKVHLAQKFLAELIGTYCIIFAGRGSVVVNVLYGHTVTFPGVCVTWALIVMAMIYTLGHVSGAHFNPAVTITLALLGLCPFKEVPFYIVSQMLGSILVSITLTLVVNVTSDEFFGTIPSGSFGQAFVVEVVITFILMFVISGASIDNRATRNHAGIIVGMTIMLNVFVAGPVTGASMNPARTLGPAIVLGKYTGIWVYIFGPITGAVAGAFVYRLLMPTDKSFRDIVKRSWSSSF